MYFNKAGLLSLSNYIIGHYQFIAIGKITLSFLCFIVSFTDDNCSLRFIWSQMQTSKY